MTTTVGIEKLTSSASNVINAYVLLQTDEILLNPVTKLNEPDVFSRVFQTLGITPTTWFISQLTLSQVRMVQVGISVYQFNVRFVQVGTKDAQASQFVGPQGPQGIQGPQGGVGPQGNVGPSGPAGPSGPSNISFVFSLSGEYSSTTIPDFFDTPRLVRYSYLLLEVTLMRRTAGTLGTTRVDILVNSTSIFATDLDKPQVNALDGDYATDVKTTFTISGVSPGDIVEPVLETVETFKAGPPSGPEGLSLEVRFV